MRYSHLGNGMVVDSHEEAADKIKSRVHFGSAKQVDFTVGFDLYTEGFTLSFCDNADQESGWHMARVGEQDAISADMEAANA